MRRLTFSDDLLLIGCNKGHLDMLSNLICSMKHAGDFKYLVLAQVKTTSVCATPGMVTERGAHGAGLFVLRVFTEEEHSSAGRKAVRGCSEYFVLRMLLNLPPLFPRYGMNSSSASANFDSPEFVAMVRSKMRVIKSLVEKG